MREELVVGGQDSEKEHKKSQSCLKKDSKCRKIILSLTYEFIE